VTRSSRGIGYFPSESQEDGAPPSPKRRIVSSPPRSYEALFRQAIDKLAVQAGKNGRLSEKYIDTIHGALLQKLDEILRLMCLVSNHRAGLNKPSSKYDNFMKEQSASLEEFLLFKEDCSNYFSKQFLSSENPQLGQGQRPVFNRAEYASHALEQEERMLLTAQSVKRLGGRDLLPLLGHRSPLVISESLLPRLVDQIVKNELRSEYVSPNS
jgi:hypothetical protein